MNELLLLTYPNTDFVYFIQLLHKLLKPRYIGLWEGVSKVSWKEMSRQKEQLHQDLCFNLHLPTALTRKSLY